MHRRRPGHGDDRRTGQLGLGHRCILASSASALTLVAGVITGVMSAAFGVGGATISTPAVRALGASAFVAVGTTLPSILPSAASGTARYAREHLVDWQVVRWAAPIGVVMSVAGSLLSHAVPGNGHWLMILTAALLGGTAWRMRKPPPRPPSTEQGRDATLRSPAAATLASIGRRSPSPVWARLRGPCPDCSASEAAS